jgi:H2-forming N5,N10-methylenetetrahydromethanopterin dehydrogenase-like enzyme
MGVPVRLLVVVDSYGKDTYVVPANVHAAVNFFQREHLVIKGAPLISAADPAHTQILENTEISLKGRDDVEAVEHSFVQRIAMDEHVRLEYVPELWNKIEKMLTAAAAAHD